MKGPSNIRGINWAHPLASRLVVAATAQANATMMDWRHGEIIRDVPGNVASSTVVSPFGYAVDSDRAGITTTGSKQEATHLSQAQIESIKSVLMVWTKSEDDGNVATLAGVSNTASASGGDRRWNIMHETWQNSGTLGTWTGNITDRASSHAQPTGNDFVHSAAVWRIAAGKKPRITFNGVTEEFGPVNISWSGAAAGERLFLGAQRANNGHRKAAYIAFVAFDTELSETAEQQLTRAPMAWTSLFSQGSRLITLGTAATTPPATDLTLEVQSGLIHVTGQSSSINLSRDLEATSALVYLLGQSTNVNLSRLLESTSGLVHLTGQSASANLARNLESTSGLVHLTGQHTQTTFGRNLQVQSALVHLTGQSTSINLARNLESTSGLVHLTGQDAQFLLSKTVLSQSALIHLAGQDVQVLTNRDLLTTSGLVYIIGQDSSISLSSMRPQWARMLNTVITVGDRSRKT